MILNVARFGTRRDFALNVTGERARQAIGRTYDGLDALSRIRQLVQAFSDCQKGLSPLCLLQSMIFTVG